MAADFSRTPPSPAPSPDASGSRLQPIEQQVNARKPPVGVWQLSTSAAASHGVIGFRLVDGDKVFDCQIVGADPDPQERRIAK
jgi:hypothetical protein